MRIFRRIEITGILSGLFKSRDKPQNFVDTHENENGVLSAEDTATYERMEAEIENLTRVIDCQTKAEQREQELNKPVNSPLTGKPYSGRHLLNTLTAALKSDDMLDLVYGLKRPYRRNASFLMNDATLASLRKLKDNNGAYIWQPSYQAEEPFYRYVYDLLMTEYTTKRQIANLPQNGL